MAKRGIPTIYIHCVIDSEPTLMRFKSKKLAKEFISNFKEDVHNGSWIDFAIRGQVVYLSEYYVEED